MDGDESQDRSLEGVSPREIIASIIKRFGGLAGIPAAVVVARKVPRLSVDEDGNVLEYDTNDPLGTILLLIEQFELLYGEIALARGLESIQPLVATTDNRLLRETGLGNCGPSSVRILVVDDQVLFRDGLARLLGAQPDFDVVGQAGTGRETITLIHKLLPQLVLLDMTLPDSTGVELIRAILGIAPGTKIVILTVHEDEERLFQAIQAGAVGYLFKNVRVTELIETLRGVMRGEAGIHASTARRVLDEFARISRAHSDKTVILTARETQVLRELANGLSNQSIARRLIISENTVKNHVRSVLVKLHLHSRHDAAEYARRYGLAPHRFLLDGSEE